MHILLAGLRKVVPCENASNQPGDGTKISSSVYSLRDEEELLKLVDNEDVDLVYWGDSAEVE